MTARTQGENVSGSAELAINLKLHHQLGSQHVHHQMGDAHESTFQSVLYCGLLEHCVAFLIEFCSVTPSFLKSDELQKKTQFLLVLDQWAWY